MMSQSRPHDNTYFCYESSNKSCTKQHYPTTVRAPLYVLLGAVIFLAIFGNLLVIITVAHFKQLHTPTNYLVLSLAVADFLVGALVMPPSMVRSLETCWYLGNVFCQIHTSMDIMLCCASILNLSLISIDRYYAVCQPLRYQTKITNSVTMTMTLICWTFSALLGFGFLELFFDLTTWGTEDIYINDLLCEGSCTVLQSRMYGIFIFVVGFFIPALLIVVLYLKILIIARRQACSIQSRVGAKVNLNKCKNSLSKTEHKATKTLGIVVGVYLACWSPWFLYYVINPEVGDSSLFLAGVLTWLAYLNSGINPIIYAFFFSWFRKSLKTALGKCFKR